MAEPAQTLKPEQWESIRATLGEEAFKAFMDRLTGVTLAAQNAAFERGKRAGWSQNSWAALFAGMRKSWTTYFAALLLAWPTYSGQILPVLQRALGDDAYQALVPIIGLLVMALRMRTDQSLEAKGSNNVPVQP